MSNSDVVAHTSDSEGEPFIPASQSPPEITVKAIVLGIVLSALLAGANAYLGLKVGMTVSASIPAAVISMAVLQLFRESNILENNIVQTATSAGESLAAGVIFTLPALLVLKYWADFPYVQTVAIAAAGGVLGVLFTIPLRRALILEADLKFPEGIATGEVLKAGTGDGERVRPIVIGGIVGALVKLFQTGFKVVGGAVEGGIRTGRSIWGFGADLSAALLAVGYIVGLNIAVLVFIGGVISWLIAIPIYSAMYGLPEGASGYQAALELWSTKIRFLGVGAMAVGGIWALVSLVKPIRDGLETAWEAVQKSRSGGENILPRTERDTPINLVGWGTLIMAVPVCIIFLSVVDQAQLEITGGLYLGTVGFSVVFALITGFLFSAVAGYMAGLVGSSNNPISGVTIATILTTSLVLLGFLGLEIDFAADATKATLAAATAIMVGGVVACASAIAGDNMQDLKAGYIVGATPMKQQIMQMIGVGAAAVIIAPVLSLLYHAYGMAGVFPREGMPQAEMLDAPQATLMASVAEGVFARNLPWTMIIIGGLIAVAIIIVDQILKARGSDFRAPVLAVAVGIYLPIELSVPIFIGGMVSYLAHRSVANRIEQFKLSLSEATERAGRKGLLFSSGLIAGEALIGILLAIPFALYESASVLRLVPTTFAPIGRIIGVIVFLAIVVWLFRVARNPK